jgi:hypothetical protein
MPESASPVGALARRHHNQALKASEPKSWGEALQRYDASRHAPAHPALLAPVPPSKHGVYNCAIKPPEFNPVRQVYADPAREQAARANESQMSAEQVVAAQWKVDHTANHKGYNILNGELKTTNTTVAASIEREDTKHRTKVTPTADGKRLISFTQPATHPPRREYNILTNAVAFEGSAERLAKAEARPIPLHNRSMKEAREYNILTNRYQYEPHAARAERESKANDAKLREKYFAASHYNPVTLQFVHPAEEARFQAAKAVAQASHGQGQLANLPPRIKRSEGQCYDILAPGLVKDAAQLHVTYDVPAEKQRATRQHSHEVERVVRTRDLTLDQQAAMKSANRVSTKRYEEQLTRGYDLLSNQPYEGRERKELFKPQADLSQHGWRKMNAEADIIAAAAAVGGRAQETTN